MPSWVRLGLTYSSLSALGIPWATITMRSHLCGCHRWALLSSGHELARHRPRTVDFRCSTDHPWGTQSRRLRPLGTAARHRPRCCSITCGHAQVGNARETWSRTGRARFFPMTLLSACAVESVDATGPSSAQKEADRLARYEEMTGHQPIEVPQPNLRPSFPRDIATRETASGTASRRAPVIMEHAPTLNCSPMRRAQAACISRPTLWTAQAG